MKKLLLSLFASIFSLWIASAQDITGLWHGAFDMQGKTFRITFGLEKSEDGYKGFMVSLDQSPQQIPLSSITYVNNELSLNIDNIGFAYDGIVKEDGTIEGEFTQSGSTFSLPLSREEIGITLVRPQHPVPPFPYREEEVSFRNERAGITLYGTLTVPEGEGPFPSVIMVAGSGPQDRDETLLEHKPFWVIADYLTRNGIAVLRYDKRGIGESEGQYEVATVSDFARDAQAAADFLRNTDKVNSGKTGIIGHSEGGKVAFVLGSRKAVDFIVSLAGPGIKGIDVSISQAEAIIRAYGAPEDKITQYIELQRETLEIGMDHMGTHEELVAKYAELFKGTPEAGQEQKMAKQMESPWLRSFLMFDPISYIKKTGCPVLALNGDKDLQVLADLNLGAIEQTLKESGNDNFTIKKYDGLNHLFQTADTGLMDEYGTIEETFNEQVLKDMTDWILSIE